MIELMIIGVRIEMPSNQPLVLLREMHGERHIPIWIGASEATAIALAEQQVVPPRPLTHDLLCQVVAALGRTILRVVLTKVEDGVFHAELVFDDGTTVSSRASDAIAIAQRARCSIWAEEEMVDDAGVVIGGAESSSSSGENDSSEERELREFREFLNDVEPEDFDN